MKVISLLELFETDYERLLAFRLLMLLLPSPNRNILEVILMTTFQMTKLSVLRGFPEDDCKRLSGLIQEFAHACVHPNFPTHKCDGIPELFCVTDMAEAILNEPALMNYFSEGGLSTKQLLQRCNSYLDLRVPNSSRIFSSLSLTGSIWSLRSSVGGEGVNVEEYEAKDEIR